MGIPPLLLRRLYSAGSLANDGDGFRFALQNRLAEAQLTRVLEVSVDDAALPLADVELVVGDGLPQRATDVTPERPANFARLQVARVRALARRLDAGRHAIRIRLDTRPFGALDLRVEDAIPTDDARAEPLPAPSSPPPSSDAATGSMAGARIPRAEEMEHDYAPEPIAARQRFVAERTGIALRHVAAFSGDPFAARGNVENFVGVAQVPLGIAGPLRIDGEHARGDFLIPLATTEGSLVASYSRGMKVLSLAGGATTTISGDAMQRAPVFIFDSAREARAFVAWVREHLDEIRAVSEATSHVAKLQHIETYLASRFAYLRFSFTTGDAAGQNMVGRATFAAYRWILEHNDTVRDAYLESNFATDKKASHVNVLHPRGKRVTAEATIPRALLAEHLRVEPARLVRHWGIASIGALLAGANNNGLHAPNALTALFIATGQDVANVAEGTAAAVYAELADDGGLYLSITLPSLIVATHGGGTGLATQRECLAMLGCTERGSVNKLAEIVAATALAGELSLAAAISSLEWVSAHERLGRNR